MPVMRWSGLWLLAALGCGGNTQQAPQPEATGAGAGAGGQPSGGAGTASKAGGAGVSQGGALGESGAPPAVAGEGGERAQGCDDVVHSCEPGETVCEPMLGKLVSCDPCGQYPTPEPDAADCARSIASDKESNAICALLGQDRLECWHGFTAPTVHEWPADAAAVLIPDDYPYQSAAPLCFRDIFGGYSCLKQGGSCGGVAVGETGACGTCEGGKPHCEGGVTLPANLPATVIDIAVTDSSAVVLSAAGVQTGVSGPWLPSNWQGEPIRFVVDHQMNGCVFSDANEMACWLDWSAAPTPAKWTKRFEKVVPTTLPEACALGAERQLFCGDVFADAAPAPRGAADVIDFVASSGRVCSLSVSGRVRCWDAAGAALELPDGW